MIHYIELAPGIRTPKGNFTFLYDATKQADLYQKCLDAEKVSKKYYNSCMNHLRSAMELLATDIELRHRLSLCGDSKSAELLAREIAEDIRTNHNPEGDGSSYNCKTILRHEIKRRSLRAEDLVNDYREFVSKGPAFLREKYEEGKVPRRYFTLINMVYDMYGYFSEGSHAAGHTTGESCEAMLRFFHDLASLLYDVPHTYQPHLCPIGDYFPIQKSLYKKLGFLDNIYVTEINGTVEYFLLKKAAGQMSRAQRRELDALKSLWKRSVDSPNNILLMQETVGEDQYRCQVLSFPDRPIALTDSLLQTLTAAEKDELALGMLKGVASLHSMTPPLPHRGLNPESFYLCKNAYGIKPFIVSFETVKDLSSDAEYTMFDKVKKLGKDKLKQCFVAPEVLTRENDENLMKADIYSLGKLFLYLYTGNVLLAETSDERIPKDKRRLIEQMTATDPGSRPAISQVLQAFLEASARKPSYAICSVKGGRGEQEDAFYCSELEEHMGDDVLLGDTAQLPLILGVYDGLGGGENGQDMSLLAARKTASFCQNLLHYELDSYSQQLRTLTEQMAKEAEEYESREGLEDAGTTMAVAVLTRKRLHIVNVGDSRIYRIHANQMELISKDHRYVSRGLKKGELYQYIGMAQEESSIAPYIREEDYAPEDVILLCTDGFSEVVSEAETLEILGTPAPLEQKVLELVDKAAENGSKDNITVILYTRGNSDEQ